MMINAIFIFSSQHCTGDVIILVLNPLRLVITKDYVLAFDVDDPTVNHWVTQLAHNTKRHYREGVCTQ